MHRIKLNDEEIDKIISELKTKLTKAKSADTKFTYTADLKVKSSTKAYVHVSPKAYNKINALVNYCSEEVAWHGVTYKTKDEEGITTYSIEDILVFPQEVTAATVTSDETKYTEWIAGLDDETFNHLRFHGHSHVNMGVFPSATDTAYQEDILRNLNDYYIFAIFNKRGDNWISIYDVTDNVVYEDKDIILDVPEDNEKEWAVQQVKEKVSEHNPYKNNKLKNKSKQNYRPYYDDMDDMNPWMNSYYGGYYGQK